MQTEKTKFINWVNENIDSYTLEDMDISIRESYSGRGMYGKTVPAIECPNWNGLLVLIAYVISENSNNEDDEQCEILGITTNVMENGFNTDSMGMGMIFY